MHSARTAPIITVIIQVTTLKTTHLRNHAQSNQNSKIPMLALGPRDLNSAPYSPVHCSSHSMTSFQSSELTELPVVENSQLFAQRAHSAGYAPTCSSTQPLWQRVLRCSFNGQFTRPCSHERTTFSCSSSAHSPFRNLSGIRLCLCSSVGMLFFHVHHVPYGLAVICTTVPTVPSGARCSGRGFVGRDSWPVCPNTHPPQVQLGTVACTLAVDAPPAPPPPPVPETNSTDKPSWNPPSPPPKR